MSSILTNHAALTALRSLNNSEMKLYTTQERISSGLRVGSATDNAAYWSIATTMRSDNMALSTVKDALSLGAATIDVASAALDSAQSVVSELKSRLVAAREPGVDRSKVQDEITALQNQLQSIADSAVFSGQNWLSVDSGSAGYNSTRSIVGSYSRDTAGAISISTIDIDISATELYDVDDQSGIVDQDRTVGATTISISSINIAALSDSAADLTILEDYISIVDAGLDDLITGASDLGAAKMRVTLQQSFVDSLTDAISKGIGALVDADMNEESTRLQSLQVQQQLGVQALSIANQNGQMILQLFRN